MKVCVLQGGPSPEAEVSRQTAKGVMDALEELAHTAMLLEFDTEHWQQQIVNSAPDFVFIAMHGAPGEDGSLQAVLDDMGLPYNGSGPQASVIAINKVSSKKLFLANGLYSAVEQVIYPEERTVTCTVPLPVVVKPSAGGSTCGLTVVCDSADWFPALDIARKVSGDAPVLVEEYIAGQELTTAVFNNKALGTIEIVPQGFGLYDYAAKYTSGNTVYTLTPDVPDSIQQKCLTWAEVAHKAVGCTGATRVDFRYDKTSGTLCVLEINTLPGLTPTSLLPKIAAANGISYTALVQLLIEDGLIQRAAKSLPQT